MTKVGEQVTGIWPEHKATDIKVGRTYRYQSGAKVARAKVEAVGVATVAFDNGEWCYLWEVSEDRD